MIYWIPSHTTFEEYSPLGGWNATLSNQEKIKSTALYSFFKKKGYSESNAIIMSDMMIYKQKYNGLQYSNEQEEMLKKALHIIQ